MFRLTNRSPFRNPRTPGRTPLGTISNRGNNQAQNGDSGSPKLPRAGAKIYDQCDKTLVQCHLTARQLNQGEVEDIWKTSTLRQVAKALGLFNLKEHLDPSQIKGLEIIIIFFLNGHDFNFFFCYRKMGTVECYPDWCERCCSVDGRNRFTSTLGPLWY